MLGTDVVVVEHACLFLGKHNNATGTVRKSLKHFATLLATTYFDATWQRWNFGACSPQGKHGRTGNKPAQPVCGTWDHGGDQIRASTIRPRSRRNPHEPADRRRPSQKTQ
ncbi:hypothetical protein GCM10027038_39950 [Arthrobacter bambusae]